MDGITDMRKIAKAMAISAALLLTACDAAEEGGGGGAHVQVIADPGVKVTVGNTTITGMVIAGPALAMIMFGALIVIGMRAHGN